MPDGAICLLSPVSAHDADDGGLFIPQRAGPGNLVGMACMKGIVLGNDTDSLHKMVPPSEKSGEK